MLTQLSPYVPNGHTVYQMEKNTCWSNTMPPAATKSEEAIFSTMVKVKVTRALTFCLKGLNQLSMHAKYDVSISYGSKVIAKVKVDNRQTNRQTNQQTDRTKTLYPRSFNPGHKNNQEVNVNFIRWCQND